MKSGNIELTGTIEIGHFTTAQRNALTPELGTEIYNTDTNVIEYWNGTAWISGSSNGKVLVSNTDVTPGYLLEKIESVSPNIVVGKDPTNGNLFISDDLGPKVTKLNNAINYPSGSKNRMNTQKQSCGVIIPAYFYPSDPYTDEKYNYLIYHAKENRDIPTIVAINPGNGPGTEVDGNYTAVIDRMTGADITVIGYISTAYMDRPLYEVLNDIAVWKSLYPNIKGIWVDEMVNWASEGRTTEEIIAYYNAIYVYSKEEAELEFVFTNPGATFDIAIWRGNVADNITMYESEGYPSEEFAAQDNPWAGSLSEMPIRAKSFLVHTATSYESATVRMLKKYCGYMYVTTDVMPNPWDNVSMFLNALYKDLDQNLDTGYGIIIEEGEIRNTAFPEKGIIDFGELPIVSIIDINNWSDLIIGRTQALYNSKITLHSNMGAQRAQTWISIKVWNSGPVTECLFDWYDPFDQHVYLTIENGRTITFFVNNCTEHNGHGNLFVTYSVS